MLYDSSQPGRCCLYYVARNPLEGSIRQRYALRQLSTWQKLLLGYLVNRTREGSYVQQYVCIPGIPYVELCNI